MDPSTSPTETPTPLAHLRLPEFRAAEPPPKRRKPLILGLVVLVLALVAGGGWWGYELTRSHAPAATPNPVYDVSGITSLVTDAGRYLKTADDNLHDLATGLTDTPGDLTEKTP